MEIDITKQKENKLLDRNEVTFYCDYTGEPTPNIIDVKSKLAALLNVKKELLVVDSLQPHYGEPKALGYAKVYGTTESLESIEAASVIEKNTEEAPEEAPEEE